MPANYKDEQIEIILHIDKVGHSNIQKYFFNKHKPPSALKAQLKKKETSSK
jgi:hypothetical protein